MTGPALGTALRRFAIAVVMAGALAACSSSGGGLSLADKAATVAVCAQVAGDVKDAGVVATRAASGKETQSQAVAELQPLAQKVQALASQNASLPVGKSLTTLAAGITALRAVAPTDANAVQRAATALATDIEDVTAACAAVGT